MTRVGKALLNRLYLELVVLFQTLYFDVLQAHVPFEILLVLLLLPFHLLLVKPLLLLHYLFAELSLGVELLFKHLFELRCIGTG